MGNGLFPEINRERSMSDIIYKKRRILCPVLAFLIPVIIMLVICVVSGFYPFGRYSVLMADMRYQFVDYFGYMKHIFFSDDTYLYSFSKTMGGDMAGLLAYYCNNPFLILLLFVPNDLLPGGILVMMILMLGFIGLTFNIFITEVYGSRYTTLIFSTSYAFMGYLMGYFNCVHYFFSVMMLPLVMLGIYRIIKTERISILYIVSQALSIFSSYYIGYMICIFSICFFIYVYFTENREIKGIKGIKEHLKPVYLYILTSIVGVFLSAVSLLCSVISLRDQSSRKHIPLSFKGNFDITAFFSGLYSNAFHGNVSDGLPLIYCGAIAAVFLAVFFLSRDITLREKLISAGIFVFLLLGFYVDILNVAWHGFSYPIGFPYRNSFLFSFMVLFLAYKAFLNIGKINRNTIITTLFIYVIYSAFLILRHNEYAGKREILITGVYVIIIFILILMYNKKLFVRQLMPAFMILMLIDVTLNAYISINSYFPDKDTDETITIEAYKDFVDETGDIVDMIRKNDNGFFRMDKLYRRSHNDAMLMGYNGLSHFSSCESENAMRFLGGLGYRDNGNWAFFGEGSTSFADCFMGLKYMLSQYNETPKPYKREFEYNNRFVYRNPYALPLCFYMNRDCLDISSGKDGLFEYQNELARSMGYTGSDIYTVLKDVKISTVNLNKEENTYTRQEKDKEAYIEFSFKNSREDFIYMYFDADGQQNTRIVVNDLEKQPYFTSYGWCIRELGHFGKGEDVILRIYAEQDSITLNGYEFSYEDKAAIAEWYKQATENKCTLEKITSSHLKGGAGFTQDGCLVFSFPYEDEWSVYIDGKKAVNLSAAGGLLAVNVEKGDHEIELKYMPKGIILGIPVSVICFIVLVILIKNRKTEEIVGLVE